MGSRDTLDPILVVPDQDGEDPPANWLPEPARWPSATGRSRTLCVPVRCHAMRRAPSPNYGWTSADTLLHVVDNERMDVPELLESASLLVPEDTATENDITVRDIWDYLAHDEWEIALGLLEELGDGRSIPLAFWEKLAEAAEQLRLERSAAWCHWRCSEIRNGVIRADLKLRPAGAGRRTTPFSGTGVLRPMWDIGHLSPTGERAVSIAALWGESMPILEPGGQATVRLVPLTPSHWTHVRSGQQITMHEDRTVAGIAVVLEVHRPAAVPGE